MIKSLGLGLILVLISSSPCLSQNAISISPNTGTSTLDNLKPTRGDQIELEFPSGFRCKVQSGDKLSAIIYGDQGSLSGIAGSRFGIGLVIPLYSSKENLCDNSMKMQDALSRLEIADKLLQSGTMSNEEYKMVTESIKNDIFNLKK